MYDALKLENQLCFPLYACSREIVKRYTPYLNKIQLTYTQYVAMMVIWEQQCITAKELGQRLYLDSGTLTPLLKNLEAKGLILRSRSPQDERSLMVTVTAAGMALREEAISIPYAMAGCTNLSPEEALQLYGLLYKILQNPDSPQ